MGKNFILGTLILLIFSQSFASAKSSYSKTVNGIRFYLQTDKSTYKLGEQVKMLYKITNLTKKTVKFTLPNCPAWNFWVEKDNVLIWQCCDIKLTVLTDVIIAQGETKIFPDDSPVIWDLKDKDGNPVGDGTYTIIGGLDGKKFKYTKISVPIVIIDKK